MTINFIVAKGVHKTLEQAMVLEPYIKDADVISLENAFASEQVAVELELYQKQWNSLPRQQRRQIQRKARKLDPGYEGQSLSIILKHSKPVVLLERHIEEEAKRLKELYAKTNEPDALLKLAVGFILDGMHEEALQVTYTDMKKTERSIRIRDPNMVQNAKTIKQRIFELYPELAEKPNIGYLVIIGAVHQIEHGLRLVPDTKVEVVNLLPWYASLDWSVQSLFKIVQENASFEESKEYIARSILSTIYYMALLRGHEHPLRVPLSNVAVKNMGVRELEALCLKIGPHAKEAEVSVNIQLFRQFFYEHGIQIPKKPSDYERLFAQYK